MYAIRSYYVYPAMIAFTRRYGGWDPIHDAVYFACAAIFAVLMAWTQAATGAASAPNSAAAG